MNLVMEVQANPSSVHGAGRNARRIIERARKSISAVIGGRSEDLVFTSGGTEANSLAINGALSKIANGVLLYSDLEHPAVRDIALSGAYPVQRINVTGKGQLDLEHLTAVLASLSTDQTPFLTLMLANNETGVIQPVAEAARLVRDYDGLTHTDGVQAIGKIPVNVGLLGVDYLSMSAHKCGGPQGVGALWLRAGAPLLPQLIGGGQERSLRSGTENLIGIAGFEAALCAAVLAEEHQKTETIRNAFEVELDDPNIVVFGQEASRLPGTCCLALEGFKGETQVMAMDLAGFSVSSGSACSSGKVKSSAVLAAMGVEDSLRSCALRVSFGYNSDVRDAVALAAAWKKAAHRVQPNMFREFA